MKIHHLRNATFVIESGDNHILIDPMLSEKGALPTFARFRHQPEANPVVSLPDNAPHILEKVTHCLITHSHTFGMKFLQHTDHLDAAGEDFLLKNNISITCRKQDAAYLNKYGLTVKTSLTYWQTSPFLHGKITSIPAQHGHGWIQYLMANGAGYYIELPNEPSLYISGDTVYTKAIDRVFNELKPDLSVVAAGCASLDLGDSILMPMDEIVLFVKNASGKVIANHLEALNHCPTKRSQLKKVLQENDLLLKTFIPNDGETIIF